MSHACFFRQFRVWENQSVIHSREFNMASSSSTGLPVDTAAPMDIEQFKRGLGIILRTCESATKTQPETLVTSEAPDTRVRTTTALSAVELTNQLTAEHNTLVYQATKVAELREELSLAVKQLNNLEYKVLDELDSSSNRCNLCFALWCAFLTLSIVALALASFFMLSAGGYQFIAIQSRLGVLETNSTRTQRVVFASEHYTGGDFVMVFVTQMLRLFVIAFLVSLINKYMFKDSQHTATTTFLVPNEKKSDSEATTEVTNTATPQQASAHIEPATKPEDAEVIPQCPSCGKRTFISKHVVTSSNEEASRTHYTCANPHHGFNGHGYPSEHRFTVPLSSTATK